MTRSGSALAGRSSCEKLGQSRLARLTCIAAQISALNMQHVASAIQRLVWTEVCQWLRRFPGAGVMPLVRQFTGRE